MSRTALANLARNVLAGARLALFLRVARLDFRIGIGSLVALVLLSALLDIGVDFARHGDDGVFSWLGVSGETYAAAALLFVSALLSLALRQRALVLALPTLIFAAYPAVQLVRLALLAAERWVEDGGILAAWQDDALLAWTAVIFVRAAAVALVPARPLRWPRAAIVALALLLPLWFGSTFAPDAPWWRPADTDADSGQGYPNPAAEPVIEAQRVLLDEALSGLADARPGVTDLYFIGFAAGESDALRGDVLSAIEVMDERWATDGRSVAFINHRASILEQPMATVSNLRDALAELQQVIDIDEDVVMLYVAGMGAPGGGIEVALPPFELRAAHASRRAAPARRCRHPLAHRRGDVLLLGRVAGGARR